jgi:CheY-like chemotaxis protein
MVTGRETLGALVAAHDRWTRESVASILEDAGFTVEQASNGFAALRIAGREAPQLILIAQDLAELSPADVADSIRSDPRTRHAALVEVGPEEPSLALDASVDEGANPVELLAAVVSALETRYAEPAAAPMRSVSASPWATWPLLGVAVSHSTSKIRNAGRSGKWRLSSDIETL